MDQLIFASLSHTHYWYEVGMLKHIGYASDTLRHTDNTEMEGLFILDMRGIINQSSQ